MNSPVINGAIGDGNIVMGNEAVWYSETDFASLDDLRELIALLRAEIEAAGSSAPADTEEVRAELGKFEEELGADNPDGEMVGIRWKLVQKLLDPLQHVASIVQLADRILTLTRTLFSGN